mgnify:CR=1 FL=1
MQENATARPRGTDRARVIQVIETLSLKGRGADQDPCRAVTQYWSLEGELLATVDPVKETEAEIKMKGDQDEKYKANDQYP